MFREREIGRGRGKQGKGWEDKEGSEAYRNTSVIHANDKRNTQIMLN